ncbi:MAG: XRE family transcriptional regulator [Nakamurella sp.]
MSGPTKAPLAAIAASLRRERERAGLSLGELGRRAGIAKSTVSQLESGSSNPSIETLWALCTAIGIPFSRIVEPPRASVRLIRSGNGPSVASATAAYAATLLSACPPNARRDVYLIAAEPGPGRHSAAHEPGVVEHVILSRGRALVGPADDPVEIGPGDYLSYPGDEPHVFTSLRAHTFAVLVSEHV